MHYAPRWKYRELISALGSAAEVVELLRADGFSPPPQKTIAGWRVRNSVPGQWAPALIGLAMQRGLLKRVSHLREAA